MDEQPVGKFLTLRDFCTCAQTYRRFKDTIDPWPQNAQSVAALTALACELLDPLIAEFKHSRFRLTYGFCSDSLRRSLLKTNPETGKPFGRIAPKLDQHMSFEMNPKGEPFCSRLGAAVDFKIDGVGGLDVASWMIKERLPFDRLYFYGKERPLHVSFGPQHSRYICGFTAANIPTTSGEVAQLIDQAKDAYRED